MASEWLKARQTKYAAYATTYIIIAIAAVVIINILADRFNKSYDSTSNKRYSLSEQTAKIVKSLKQDATITYFNQNTHFREGRDLLDEYANLSHKVHVAYVDPDKDPQLAREAGIRNLGTAVVQIGDKKEEAKGMTEEGVTGAFIRALKNTTRTVCFVAGSGEHQLDDSDREGLSHFKDSLAKDNYETKAIDLLQKAEVPAECTTLIVAGPTRNYEQPEVDAIKKYVEAGGRALFMLDPPLKMGRSEIADNDGLATVLQSWGVTLDKDLILDLNPLGQMVGLGPQVALVTAYESHPIVSEMKGTAVGIPLARSLQVKNTDKSSVEKLFDSSSSSLATNDLNSPKINLKDPKNKQGPFTLAAAGTYNTGKENSQGRFVVVGSSSWVSNRFVNFNGNDDLALNTINWLSSDEDLISIRPKPEDDRRITMTKGQMSMVRATSLLLLPGIVLILGIGVWWKRR
ncbi:MAG TPA: GldG family protein [Candidatus Sulfotelmatobacter sp.]|nr:GldG family protein [Candidatus Sulfotelmatobacter sp.]